MKKNLKRITASVLAATLCATPIISPYAGNFGKAMTVNTIIASAYEHGVDGKWEFDITSKNTATITAYTGTATDVIVPEAVKKNGKGYTVKAISGAFYKNKKIVSVKIPRGLTEIEKNTFSGASNLTQVFIPDGVTTIGDSAFSATNLHNIILPRGLEKIGIYAFSYTPLASVTFNNCINEIGHHAFFKTNLTSVTIPASVNKFGDDVFRGCEKLVNINVGELTLDKMLDTGFLGGCNNLTKINNITVTNISRKGRPYFDAEYEYYMKKHFASMDDFEVSFMTQYIDAMVKYVVKTETAGCVTDQQKVRKLHDWICDKVDYAYEADGKTPAKTLGVHCDSSVFFRDTTVCDGYARALTLLLNEAGIEAYYVSAGPVGDGHAWTIVKLGGNYYHIDACHDDGKGKGNRDYSHYLVSESKLQATCSTHLNWKVAKPNSRYKYEVPKTKPECNYTW